MISVTHPPADPAYRAALAAEQQACDRDARQLEDAALRAHRAETKTMLLREATALARTAHQASLEMLRARRGSLLSAVA